MNWRENKRWSDKFLDEVKRILGQQLIAEAPYEEDRDRNTDLIVLTLQPYRVACRIRRHEYYNRYPYDFTIRSAVPSGRSSELRKIIEGWGDYFFYGFANKDEDGLIQWILGDLKCFRVWFNRQIIRLRGELPGQEIENEDGSSRFRVYDYRKLPATFVVASTNDFLSTAKRPQHERAG